MQDNMSHDANVNLLILVGFWDLGRLRLNVDTENVITIYGIISLHLH